MNSLGMNPINLKCNIRDQSNKDGVVTKLVNPYASFYKLYKFKSYKFVFLLNTNYQTHHIFK